jgi:hypothetical protein
MNYPVAYCKALKYAASETSKQLFNTIAKKSSEFGAATKPPDKTLHGAFADSLDDNGESPELAYLIRSHYGISGEHGEHPPAFGNNQISYATGRPFGTLPIHEDENYAYHLGHTSSPGYTDSL